MGDFFVRNVDDATLAQLKTKAKAQGKSMNDLAREALHAAVKPRKEEIWAEADRIRAKFAPASVTICPTRPPAFVKIVTAAKGDDHRRRRQLRRRILLPKPGSDRAAAIQTAHDDLHAPSLAYAEIGSAIWRADGVPAAEVRRDLKVAISHYSRILPIAELADRAFELATRLRHPIYDCFYWRSPSANDAH